MNDLTIADRQRHSLPATTAQRPGRLAETLAAALVIAIGMGFGRFAFTGMYPLMVGDGLMSLNQGSLIASSNYAGYLAGALLVSRLPDSRAAATARGSMLGTVLLLALLAFPMAPWAIGAVRFLAGVSSAISLITAAVWLLQVVEHPNGAPLLFSGVGFGIFASAELIALGAHFDLHSGMLWIVLALVAAIFSVVAWPVLSKSVVRIALTPAEHPGKIHEHGLMNPWVLVLVYGLAGFGYIVTATYLPVLIKSAAPDIDPLQIWAAFGIGAMPSCFFWHWLHMKAGTRRAMFFNLACQAIGVALPAVMPNLAGFLVSALLVGGTFVGTVTIAMPAGKRLAHRINFNILASMTAAYGAGQIAGPLVASALLTRTHSFALSLICAASALVAGAFISLF
jgi:MFS family permease